ncbi:hypothetical protein MYU51_002359 [Penicillium brevicompactum]|uniref:uncharacterized protein n=1 Tax=Penicillium brevicompactum TaxID=5074 RepID=UPI0025405FD3|nr:uncharacterized protein N7506_003633 [Penicillium brevicompactum]KAJ5343809.1 hypothetical protein N7506_003633 [Penicillium brevicompactum]
MSVPLTKVDSAVAGLSISDEKPIEIDLTQEKKGKRQSSAAAPGVWSMADLGQYLFPHYTHIILTAAEKQKIEITLPIETQKTGWKLNTSPNTIEDKDILKMLLINPPVKKIDLHFPLGLEVTARNSKGVTIKDALDVIYKQFKKKADDELDKPYLAGFEWDKDECWTRLIVHQTKQGAPAPPSKKSKKKAKEEA